MLATRRKRKCICKKNELLRQLTGTPEPLHNTEINKIRLSLFTEKNSDGTGHLVLIGKDIYEKYNRRITDADIRAICIYLKESRRRIIKLDLSYNNITDEGFIKLLKKVLIKGRSSLLNLNIMNNDLTEASIEYLMKNASLIKLKYLRLNGNKFGTAGGEFFARFLMNNDSVHFCDVGDTGQTLTSVAAITSALRSDYGDNRSVKVFDLSRTLPLFNRYPYESKWLAYHIELLIERNSTIVELHLQKNELVGHDMEYFVRGLRNNQTLLYLDLGYNKIGDYGAELLGKYFADKPQLRALIIAGNSINDLGASALSFGFPYSKLRAVDIGNNRLTDDGILHILYTIRKSYFIRFFNIWGNQIGSKSCEIIQRMLCSGVLFQHTLDVKIFESDGVLHAAYYPNPADRNKHFYYNELEFGCAQPIYHIKRNVVPANKQVKGDWKQRYKLDKIDTRRY